MKIAITLAMVIFCFNALSQEVKIITEKQKKSPYYTEKFEVLKSDKSIRHGSYKALGWKKCLVIEGQYSNNQKVGLWTTYFYRTKEIEKIENYENDLLHGEYKEYSGFAVNSFLLTTGFYSKGLRTGQWEEHYFMSNSKKASGSYQNGEKDGNWSFYHYNSTLSSSGDYDQGVKIGEWKYYDEEGTIEQIFNHTNSTVVRFVEEDKYLERVLKDGLETELEVERPCLFIGGNSEKMSIVLESVIYSDLAKENGHQGTVTVSFIVNADSSMSEFKILRSDASTLNNSSIEAVKNLSGMWIPAIVDGVKTATIQTIDIKYRLK